MAAQLSWFLTPTGKKFSAGVMATASVATFGISFFPQTFFIQKYKEVVCMYESAAPVPLSERVRKRWDETLKDLSIPDHEKKYLEPFTVFGFDMFRAGTVSGRWGAIIGIPSNFTYTDVSTVDPTPIRVNNESVNWNREDAKQLLESLVLSEDAQRYGIGREVLMVRNEEPMIFSLLGAFMVSSTYFLCRALNNKFHLLERPFPFRAFFYLLGGLSSFGVWATQKDMLSVMWEKDADQHLSQLDVRYSKGAVEFYDKLLKRNMALRSLIGAEGEATFAPNGNERHLFRKPSIPIDERKAFFEKKVAERTREKESLEDVVAVPAPA